MRFTIDQLNVTIDSMSNPIWYTLDERNPVHLDVEQDFVSVYKRFCEYNDKYMFCGPYSDEEEAVTIPIRPAICTRCRGKGTIANPAFNGTTMEWWQEHGGPDWEDDLYEYCHGDMYDVECEYHCDNGIASAVDWQRIINVHKLLGDIDKANKWINDVSSIIDEWHRSEQEAASEANYFNSLEV